MPANKSPRKKRTRKILKNFHGARPIMRIFSQTHGVSFSNRIMAQNEVLFIVNHLENHQSDKEIVDRAGYAGALWEALCRNGYGELDEPLALDFEAARQAALRRGEQLGRYGMNPKEIDAVKAVLFLLIESIKITPEPVFKKIDDEVRDFLLIK